MERAAKHKTSGALQKLLDLQPSTATLVEDGEDKVINCRLLHRGDLVRVVPGTSLPSDGTVVSGESSVDESMITGEPIPVTKVAGSSVVGGTLNREVREDPFLNVPVGLWQDLHLTTVGRVQLLFKSPQLGKTLFCRELLAWCQKPRFVYSGVR